jgi:hypothetical protein
MAVMVTKGLAAPNTTFGHINEAMGTIHAALQNAAASQAVT